jgi:hypothetical protein
MHTLRAALPKETQMALAIRALHGAPQAELLLEEWILVENTGTGPLSSNGWTLATSRARGQRPSALGTIAPGFVLQAGEKVRMITGSPGKKAQGSALVEDGVKNYFLMLRESVLKKGGTSVHFSLKQLELARATFDPAAPNGLRAE